MRRVLPFLAAGMILLGAHQKGLLSPVAGWLKAERPDEEAARLEGECAALRSAIRQETKVLYRLQNQYQAARKQRLGGGVMQQLLAPLYASRGRIEEAKEALIFKEQRLAVVKEDVRQLTGGGE